VRRYLVPVLIVGVAFVAFVSLRVLWEGWHEYSAGISALTQGKEDEGIEHLIWAARWYFPVAGAHEKARRELWRLANRLESQKRFKEALRLYRELRAAILVTRSFYTPDSELLAETEERIAHLMAPNDRIKQKLYLSQLRHHLEPKRGYAILAVLTFLVWIGVTARGLYLSVTREGKVQYPRLGLTILESLGLLGLWLLFLRLA